MSGKPFDGPSVVLSTHNQGKIRELKAMVAHWGLDISVLDAATAGLADVPETGTTFAQNALIKARAAAQQSGQIALADDSGLAVDILGGSPGILSARWSGKHGDDGANLRLLLDQLRDIPAEHRGAQFVCAMALVDPTGEEHVVHGMMTGTLLCEPLGTHGFGYDPIFAPHGQGGLSCAQLSPERKNAISHRALAMEEIRPHLLKAVAQRTQAHVPSSPWGRSPGE